MADHIKIRKASGTWVVRAGGAVLGESANALEITEGSYPAAIYFPRDDIGMAFLDKTESATTCQHKGVATYYTIHAVGEDLIDAAWSYEAPIAGMEEIAGYVSFYTDRVAVEQL